MKTVCVLMVLALSGLGSMAQAQVPLGFGFKLGCVAANQTGQMGHYLEESQDNRWGIIAGAFIDVLDLPHFTLTVEFDYVQKGAKSTLIVTWPDGEERPLGSTRVDYLSVPLLAKIHTAVGRLTPYLVIGPTVDVPFNTDFDGYMMLSDRADHDRGDFKRIDVGAVFGFGLELPAHPVIPVVEFRYCPSFTKAIDTKGFSMWNRSIELLLGARF